jgi:hypothetical protein
VPVLAIRLAATDAVSCVALTNVVGRAEPFHCTVAPERKPVPFTVSVKAALPPATEPGSNDEMVGGGACGLIVNAKLCVATGEELASVMLKSKLQVPADCGVPTMVPADILRPPGRLPEEINHDE